MQNIAINVTSNVQSHTWSGLASHVDRDNKTYSNKKINPKYTKYNLMLSRQNLKPTIYKHFAKLVAKHDAKYKGTKHASRMYGSAKNYLARRHGKPESTVVLKIGSEHNKNDKNDKKIMENAVRKASPTPMSKLEAKAKVKELDDEAFKLDMKGYQQRHPIGKSAIPLGHAETNEDEAGMDHTHYNIADLGFTKKGNPSMGFSFAVEREYGTSNRHEAMKRWHNQEDPAMIGCMNYVYHRYGIHFSLRRTGHAYHLGQQVYQEAEAHKEKAKAETTKQFQRLGASIRLLIKQNSKLKRQPSQAELLAMKNRIARQSARIHALEKANKGWSQSYNRLKKRHQNLKNQLQSLSKSTKNLNSLLQRPNSSLRNILHGYVIKLTKSELDKEKKNKPK